MTQGRSNIRPMEKKSFDNALVNTLNRWARIKTRRRCVESESHRGHAQRSQGILRRLIPFLSLTCARLATEINDKNEAFIA